MAKLQISVEERTIGSDDIAVINLKGVLDAWTVSDLENTLESLLKEKQIYNWLFDFEGLDFISSSGIGVLLLNFGKVDENGGSIKLTNLSENVSEVFKLSGLLNIFEVVDSDNIYS